MSKNWLFIGLGRISQMLLMFLTYRTLSSVFTIEAMGDYYFLLSIASIFGLLLANPLGVYTIRKINDWKKNGTLVTNINSLIIIFIFSSLAVAPVLYLYRNKITNPNLGLKASIPILILYVFSTSINGTLTPLLNLLDETIHFVFWTFVTSILGLLFSFTMIHYFLADPLIWLLGQGLSLAFVGIIVYHLLKKKFTRTIKTERKLTYINIKKVFVFASPIALTNIFVWIMSQSFRFFLKDNINPTTLGEIVFGMGLATSLSVSVEYLLQQLFTPTYFKNISDENKHRGTEWSSLFNTMAPLYIYLLFYLYFLSPFIMKILADQKFKNSAHFFALGAFVEFFRIISNIFNMANQSEMKMHKSINPNVLGGIVTISGIFFICKNPSLVKYVPFVLMSGNFLICFLLSVNAHKMFTIDIKFIKLLKSFFYSLAFAGAYFLWPLQENLIFSIATCGAFGIYLLILFHQGYKEWHGQAITLKN